MAPPLRLGLIGAGGWGRNYIQTIKKLANVRLTRLASRNPESASIVPPGCMVVSDWRALLDPKVLDGLIIATPPGLHAEMALAAMEMQLPVLIEKPLTMDIAQARAIRDKALERQIVTMIDHTPLFHPAYRKLKSLQPQFGPVREIHSEAGRTGPFRPDAPVLWDWGPHDVAMCLDLLGRRPTRAFARIAERQSVGATEGETVELKLEFPQHIGATISVSNILTRKTRRLTVSCERATIVYDEFGREKLLVRESRDVRPIDIEPELPLTIAVREFAAAISSGQFDPGCIELGVGVVEVLSACAVNAYPN